MCVRQIPAVAVIMSVYKSDTLENVEKAVFSIASQDYENFSIFIFKDGALSSDVDSFLNKYSCAHNVVTINSDKNLGLAVALNTLIDKALLGSEYEFIARMDSDDISRPSRLSTQVQFMKLHEHVDVCGTSCHEFGADFALDEKHLPENHADLLDFSISRCPFIHPTVMFRRRVFESGVRYPTSTNLTEDMALWFELLSMGYVFSNINEVLLDYRLNQNTLKRRHGVKKALSEIKIRLAYMFKLRRVTAKNVFLIISRLFFHLMPERLMSVVYKNARKKYKRT
ncbi:glycosyltransferase [Citrobacter sp. S2-9]|uniref:Glycosyltransferase n=1 Tax=Citrobacter enshiensis TaxID=2971264 RepID=A0ABT8PTE7_9ENTR|nr:glycosyltransferase [Citrobacter enshiensis]MDN8599606.1 glycosyltransferase [Citrobacter enshiensis]